MAIKEFTIILITAALLNTATAQFEDLEACLKPDFFAKFGGCLASSIIGGFDGLPRPYGEDQHGSGRRLQSLESDVALSNGAKKYYINMKMQQNGIRQGVIFEKLKSLGKMWSIGHRGDSWFEKLRNLDLAGLIGDSHLSLFDDYLGDILEVVARLHTYEDMQASGDTSFLNDEFETYDEKNIQTVLTCLNNSEPADFEDGLDWLQCLVACDDLGPLWVCTEEAMRYHSEECANSAWFADILVALFSSFLNKSQCDFVVDPMPVGGALSLAEGGEEDYVNIRSYLPPGVLCIGPNPLGDPIQLGLAVVGNIFGFNYTCDVEMQLTTSNWVDNVLPAGVPNGRPKCRVPNRALRQVAIGYHDAAVNNSGVFKITNDNWNKTFEIPLLPVVDHRVDGDVDVAFTMKMFVQQEMRGETIKINVRVNDTDVDTPAPATGVGAVECYSLNDPHIMTFDGHYYDNYHQGAFYLYKHTELPYEVQVIYQPCEQANNNASCNCAVAVKSGDDVFVMDRCRRCEGDVCEVNQLTIMYTQGFITPGTRIFRANGGLRHDIVLPHGTIVRAVASNELLNVWIMPGSYDYNNTLGLCGTYNGDASDDLTLPDGSEYTGLGDGLGEQPVDFNKAWRVPVEDQIFYGAQMLNETFSPLDTCVCTHVLFAGAQCECGRGSLTEICDLFLENEYTSDNISSIVLPSLNNGSMPDYLTSIEVNVAYEPVVKTTWDGVWNETAASDFCAALVRDTSNPVIMECLPGMGFDETDMPAIHAFCMKDIQLLDNTNWQHSVIDNAMYRCYNQLVRDVNTRAAAINLYPNSSCVNECNAKGFCDQGVCVCIEGYYGPDCQPMTVSTPYLVGKATNTQLCDTRKQMCQFATIFGYNFPNDGTMLCQLRNVEISPEGVDYLPVRYTEYWEQAMTVISSNQAVCPLPHNGSYEVFAVWDSAPAPPTLWEDMSASILGNSHHNRLKRQVDQVLTMEAGIQADESLDVKFIYISYDSACYSCDATAQACVKKETPDHCWINGTCWAPGQTKPDDSCRLCDPQLDMTDWTMSNATIVCYEQAIQEEQDKEDQKQDMILRGAIGGTISALVILIVIILFCVSRKKEKAAEMEKERLKREGPGRTRNEDSIGYDNLGISTQDESHFASINRNNSINSGKLSRVDVLKSEELHRSNSKKSTTSSVIIADEEFKTAF